MKPQYLFIILIFLVFSNTQAQELKATLISEDEVELEISNPEQLWFFMPYTQNISYVLFGKKYSIYGIHPIIYNNNKESDCVYIIEFINNRREKFERVGSGYFSYEKVIKQRYKIKFSSCEREELEKNNISIEFVLSQKNIHQMPLFKKELKSYQKQNRIFNGELTSNRISIDEFRSNK